MKRANADKQPPVKRACLASPIVDQTLLKIIQNNNAPNRTELVTQVLQNESSNSIKLELPSLLYCAANGDTEMLQTLLSHNIIDPNVRTPKGQNILTIGITLRNTTIVLMALNHPAFVLQPKDLELALIYSAFNGHANVLQLILSRGVDITNIKDRKDSTPLMMAAYNGHLGIVKMLAEHQSVNMNAVNTDGQSICHIASVRGHADILEYSISKGGDPTLNDNAMMTPLHYGSQENHAKVVQVLLKCPTVQIDAKNNDGMSPLFLAAQEGAVDVLNELLAHNREGIDIDYMDTQGMTALRFSIIANRPEAIKVLLKHGADPGKLDRGNFTCLHTVAYYGHTDALRAMIEAAPEKLNYFAQSRANNIPLYVAVCRGHMEIVDIMVQQEPKLLEETKNNQTWLHFAENEAIEKYFIEKGVTSCHAPGILHKGCAKCNVSYCDLCSIVEERCHSEGCSYFLCKHCAKNDHLEEMNQWNGKFKYCSNCVRLNKSWNRFGDQATRNIMVDCDIICAHNGEYDQIC